MFIMSAIKNYLKKELQWSKLGLKHPKPADFYLSVWQTTQSPVPLLIYRVILFLASISIVLASVVSYGRQGIAPYWPMYMTHWGVAMIGLTTGFATWVSSLVYLYGPTKAGSESRLPWLVKTSWVLYNITNPITYFISYLYWSVLYRRNVNEESTFALSVAVHIFNAVIMFLLQFSGSVPTRLLHIFHPLLFSIGWVIFSVIYYFAGGTNEIGNRFIYPMINWSKPGPTLAWVACTAPVVALLHLAVIGLAALRDTAARRVRRASVTSQTNNP